MSQRTRTARTGAGVSGPVATERRPRLGTSVPGGAPQPVTMISAVIGGRRAGRASGASRKAHDIACDPRATCLIEGGADRSAPAGAPAYGTARVVTGPDRVRYVCAQVVRRMTDLTEEDAIAPSVAATAATRYARFVEPVRVASWDHRKLS